MAGNIQEISLAAEFEKTVAGSGTVELEVRKSRFIGSVFRVIDEIEARSLIDVVRKEYWNANHNCTAWRIGPQGRLQRTSDDGEPAGTAGVPMLEVLNHRDVTDTLVIVTRYFGGVKLGAGGLIRAYGSTVSVVLDAVGIVERKPLSEVTVSIGHADSGKFENHLRATDYLLAATEYTADGVDYTVHIEPHEFAAYATMVAELTAGRYAPVETGTRIVEVPVSVKQR